MCLLLLSTRWRAPGANGSERLDALCAFLDLGIRAAVDFGILALHTAGAGSILGASTHHDILNMRAPGMTLHRIRSSFVGARTLPAAVVLAGARRPITMLLTTQLRHDLLRPAAAATDLYQHLFCSWPSEVYIMILPAFASSAGHLDLLPEADLRLSRHAYAMVDRRDRFVVGPSHVTAGLSLDTQRYFTARPCDPVPTGVKIFS